MDKVQVEILGLSSSPSAGGGFALLLKETFGLRRLPIIIGSFEAQSIALELEGHKHPRPLTHDLMKSVIEGLGGTVQEVQVTELRDNTFFGKIIIEISGLTNEIDSRPSDAIALAVRTGSPIYVAEEVMRKASFVPSGEEEPTSEEYIDDEDPFEETQRDKTFVNDKEARIASLQSQLREAIEKEEYERAAKLRDEINKLKNSSN